MQEWIPRKPTQSERRTQFMLTLARYGSASASMLSMLMQNDCGMVRFEAARNNNLDAKDMERAILGSDYYQLSGIARNENASGRILAQLAEIAAWNTPRLDPNQLNLLRSDVIRNRNTPMISVMQISKITIEEIKKKYPDKVHMISYDSSFITQEERVLIKAMQDALMGSRILAALERDAQKDTNKNENCQDTQILDRLWLDTSMRNIDEIWRRS